MQFEELLCALRRDYPDLVFKNGKKFIYRPPRTVVFEQLPEPATVLDSLSQNAHADFEQNSVSQSVDALRGREKLATPANSEQNYYCLQLLHEVGHAILRHRDYATDPARIKMERAAWDQAERLCSQYNIYYDVDFVEAELDTYRDWLHRRSLCKRCGLTCYQLKNGQYRCPRCDDLLGGLEV